MANPIRLLSQNFYKELSAASVSWLLGNVGDKIRVETSISIEIYAVGSSDQMFTLNATDGYIGTGWVFDPQGQFANFNIGDTVLFRNQTDGSVYTFTIIDKKDNSSIQLSAKFTTVGDNYQLGNATFTVTTPITSLRYRYNTITNTGSDTFISAIDGISEQLFISKSKAASDTSLSAMEPQNALTWQEGLAGSLTTDFSGSSVPVCQIQGIQIDDGTTDGVYKSQFKIVHYTRISPYLLYLMTIPPFKDSNCLKFITQVDALYYYTDPNFVRSQIFDSILGNVGWYNENFATGKTNYSIANLAYSNGGNAVDSIQLDASETTVTFDIYNTVNTPFSSGNTKFVLGFFKVPTDVAEYQNNGQLLDINFLFDRAKQTVGSGAVNGDNYGGTYQVLKGISAAFVSSSRITVTAKIDMAAAVLTAFDKSSPPQYLLFVSVQDHTKATNASDLVTLEVDKEPFTIVTSDPTMIVPSNTFIRHPEVNPATEGITPGAIATPEVLATIDYDASAWTGGSATFNLQLNFNFLLGGSNTWTAAGQSSINAAMTALVSAINAATGITSVTWNNTTKILHIVAPVGSGATGNTYTISFSASGGGAPSITPSSGSFSGGVDPTYQQLDVFPEDELVACSEFYIDRTGRTSNEIILQSINGRIVAKNGAKEFELDQYIMQLSSFPFVGDSQQFDAQVARAFHIPVGTIRKYIEVKRRNDLDSGNKRYFSANYPLLWRWEYWTAALGVDAAFFDTTKPNNGFNEWWYQYAQVSGWSLNYELNISATKDGTPQAYQLVQPILPHDYRSNSAYVLKEVVTFDNIDHTKQLCTGGNTDVTINSQVYHTKFDKQFLYTDRDTLVRAIFTKNSTPANVTVVIGMEIWEQGGIYGKRRFSSKWQADSDTWFKSSDPTGTPLKVVVNAYGNSIVAECYIDYTKLPANIQSYKLSARIYEIGGVLETDDGVPITTDDGVQIEVD